MIPKIWENGTVWIIGGGNSITSLFDIPAEAVNQAEISKDLSILSPYMGLLHDKHVIGVNVAAQLGNWVDILFYGDITFATKHKKLIEAYKGLKYTTQKRGTLPGVKYIPQFTPKFGLSKVDGQLCWNNNSGGAAIDLAIQLGAKNIMLLGFDMTFVDGKQHFHGNYVKKTEKEVPFDIHMKGFDMISHHAVQRGINIYNLSEQSNIHCFPKINLEKALEICTNKS